MLISIFQYLFLRSKARHRGLETFNNVTFPLPFRLTTSILSFQYSAKYNLLPSGSTAIPYTPCTSTKTSYEPLQELTS